MPTLFTRIILGEIPCYKIAEDEQFFAFLDIMPVRPGHMLVVPKPEIDRLWDLPEAYTNALLGFARPLALAMKNAFAYDRVNVMTLGFEVPHAHLHLMGMNSMADFEGGATRVKATESELLAAQKKILAQLHS